MPKAFLASVVCSCRNGLIRTVEGDLAICDCARGDALQVAETRRRWHWDGTRRLSLNRRDALIAAALAVLALLVNAAISVVCAAP